VDFDQLERAGFLASPALTAACAAFTSFARGYPANNALRLGARAWQAVRS